MKNKKRSVKRSLEDRIKMKVQMWWLRYRLSRVIGEWHHGDHLSLFTKTLDGRMYVLESREKK